MMNPYFEQTVMNAGPVELVQLLHQKAIACVRDAREHLHHHRIADRARMIGDAYAVIAELQNSLRPEVAPDLTGRLQGLYLYMQRLLLEANFAQSDPPLAEVLSLLTTLGDGWAGITSQSAPRQESADAWMDRGAGAAGIGFASKWIYGLDGRNKRLSGPLARQRPDEIRRRRAPLPNCARLDKLKHIPTAASLSRVRSPQAGETASATGGFAGLLWQGRSRRPGRLFWPVPLRPGRKRLHSTDPPPCRASRSHLHASTSTFGRSLVLRSLWRLQCVLAARGRVSSDVVSKLIFI